MRKGDDTSNGTATPGWKEEREEKWNKKIKNEKKTKALGVDEKFDWSTTDYPGERGEGASGGGLGKCQNRVFLKPKSTNNGNLGREGRGEKRKKEPFSDKARKTKRTGANMMGGISWKSSPKKVSAKRERKKKSKRLIVARVGELHRTWNRAIKNGRLYDSEKRNEGR